MNAFTIREIREIKVRPESFHRPFTKTSFAVRTRYAAVVKAGRYLPTLPLERIFVSSFRSLKISSQPGRYPVQFSILSPHPFFLQKRRSLNQDVNSLSFPTSCNNRSVTSAMASSRLISISNRSGKCISRAKNATVFEKLSIVLTENEL